MLWQKIYPSKSSLQATNQSAEMLTKLEHLLVLWNKFSSTDLTCSGNTGVSFLLGFYLNLFMFNSMLSFYSRITWAFCLFYFFSAGFVLCTCGYWCVFVYSITISDLTTEHWGWKWMWFKALFSMLSIQ